MSTGTETHLTLPLGPVQPRRLLDTIPRLPAVADGNPDRWMEGVAWEPFVCRPLTVDNETACDTDGQPAGLVPAECDTWETQPSFRISDAMTNSTFAAVTTASRNDLVARYNRQVSAAFAAELLSGDASGGISLSSEATAPDGAAFAGAALGLWFAIGVLEAEIAERLQGGVGYLHVSPALISRMVVECGLRINGDGVWETPAGNVVLSDAGYRNPPAPNSGGAVSGAGTDWVYASGPVWFESTAPISVGAGSQTFVGSAAGTPWDRNTLVQFVNGYGILVFDPCPVTAVRVGLHESGQTFGS